MLERSWVRLGGQGSGLAFRGSRGCLGVVSGRSSGALGCSSDALGLSWGGLGGCSWGTLGAFGCPLGSRKKRNRCCSFVLEWFREHVVSREGTKHHVVVLFGRSWGGLMRSWSKSLPLGRLGTVYDFS